MYYEIYVQKRIYNFSNIPYINLEKSYKYIYKMSMYYSALVVLSIIISVITLDKPTTNTCKYGEAEYPKESSDCVKTRMSNGYSCCYEEYQTGGTGDVQKYCVKEQLSSTVNEASIASALGGDADKVKVICPKSSSVPNNCGIIGINEPSILEECSNITIPESYCCLVKHSGGASCRRLDYYPSKDDKNKELKEEISEYGEEFISVECSDRFKHYATTLLVLTLLFVVL